MADWDVIVIGGGLGGMTAANYLAAMGKRTLVLEQARQTGGNMTGFRRRGFYFDGGDQSFESLGIVFPVLEELGIYDRIRWSRARFRMVSPDFDFFVDSFDGVEDALRTAFPDEKGIVPMFREIRRVARFLQAHYDPRSFPLLHDFSFLRLLGLAPHLPRLRKWLTHDYRVQVCSRIDNPALRRWFTHIGYYRMPFIFFAGFWHLWMKDYWYPVGGMQGLNDAIAARFVERGGEIRFGARVTGIETRGGRAVAAVTSEGDVFSAPHFVYAGDYKRLAAEILPPGTFKPSFAGKVAGARLTEELLCVYLGVDYSPEYLSSLLGAQHAFYFPDYEAVFPDGRSPEDVHRNMWILLNHFGGENPGGAPPGQSALVLQTYSSWDWLGRWGTGLPRENGRTAERDGRTAEGDGGPPRTPAYRELKRRVSEELAEQAEHLVPGLRPRILYSDAGTPLSSERFTLNTRGSSGGFSYYDRESLVYRFPALNLIRTPLDNLLTCGHYSLWPGGVISAALSGKIAANLLLKQPPLAALRSYAGKDRSGLPRNESSRTI